MTEWELRLERLKDKTNNLEHKIGDAYLRMMEDPHYDAYADLSAAVGDLNSLMATIEDMKKYKAPAEGLITPQELPERVANLLERIRLISVANLLDKVERTQKKMLQDPSYKALHDIDYIARRLGELHSELCQTSYMR